MFLLVHDSSWLLPQSQPSCVSGFGLACDLGRFLETWAILWGFIEVQSSQELNLWISMESNMFRVSEVMEKWKNGEKHPQLSSMDDGFSMEINHINTIGVPPNSFIHFLDHFWIIFEIKKNWEFPLWKSTYWMIKLGSTQSTLSNEFSNDDSMIHNWRIFFQGWTTIELVREMQ